MASSAIAKPAAPKEPCRVFLCGDVMTGRGVDQALPHPGDPQVHEPWVKDARRYVELAERVNGSIPKPIPLSYIWGHADATLQAGDVRIVNLETAVTATGSPAEKGIHYRMHPKNIGCITSAGIDCCVLANNHVLDWGRKGLVETLEVLQRAGLSTAGAGRGEHEATQPAVCECKTGRVLVFAFGMRDSGIPPSWAASAGRAGVNVLSMRQDAVSRIAAAVKTWRRPNDVVVASIHWGGNWGYQIPAEHRAMAHRMVEQGGVDVVHGHSSHHAKGIEVHDGKLILYGCGDFINDYEGIGGHQRYRPDLVLAYLASVSSSQGSLEGLRMVPFQMHRFRLRRASKRDARWLRELIAREGAPLGTDADLDTDDSIVLRW